jgi:predicted NBD/HSP70 family sugar kinase
MPLDSVAVVTSHPDLQDRTMRLILTINPGTTTTRLGLFESRNETVKATEERTIEHDETVMAGFADIADQLRGLLPLHVVLPGSAHR